MLTREVDRVGTLLRLSHAARGADGTATVGLATITYRLTLPTAAETRKRTAGADGDRTWYDAGLSSSGDMTSQLPELSAKALNGLRSDLGHP
jgi:hypothetical protein